LRAYQGKAAIVFIDVWKLPEQGKKFKVSIIPTQIFLACPVSMIVLINRKTAGCAGS